MPPPSSPPARHRDNGPSADNDDADDQRHPRLPHNEVQRSHAREYPIVVHQDLDTVASSKCGVHRDYDQQCLASGVDSSNTELDIETQASLRINSYSSGFGGYDDDILFDGDDEDDEEEEEEEEEEEYDDGDDNDDDYHDQETDEVESDLDDRDSTGDPVHHLHHLSLPSDLDLDMSESDGGAPLHVFPLLHNPEGFQLNLELGFDSEPDPETDEPVNHNEQDLDPFDPEPDNSNQHPPSLFSFSLHHNSHVNMDDEVIPALPWATDPTMPGAMLSAAGADLTLANPPPFFDAFADTFQPVQLSNPNPTILGSENLGLVDFLREWAHGGCFSPNSRPRPPHLHEVHKQAHTVVQDVTYEDLQGDECDFQGLNWISMETTRADARTRRRHRYKNYVNRHGSDGFCHEHRRLPSRDSFFRFNRMHIRTDVSLAHFQLRSVLACPSRTNAYYSSPSGINRTNFASKKTETVLNLREFPAMGGIISTLDAGHGVLMGGTFNGDYCIQSLDSEESKGFSEGQISPDGITNHVRVHTPRRSARPVASIASNDRGFRVMDLETEVFTSRTTYDFAMNCSALSPDGRLRVLVGDDPMVLIVNADTGETLRGLTGHHDYGFACDWSDDGWTVATGFQDKSVKIWDARRWCNSSGVSTPLCTIRSEMAGVRGLRFSPIGGGHPILVAAEEADFINLIDAQTFASKQTIDLFSEIGGIAFTNEGQDLNVLCCDANRGGLLQLTRCGGAPEISQYHTRRRSARRHHEILADDSDDQDLWHNKWTRNRIPPLLQGPEPF